MCSALLLSLSLSLSLADLNGCWHGGGGWQTVSSARLPRGPQRHTRRDEGRRERRETRDEEGTVRQQAMAARRMQSSQRRRRRRSRQGMGWSRFASHFTHPSRCRCCRHTAICDTANRAHTHTHTHIRHTSALCIPAPRLDHSCLAASPLGYHKRASSPFLVASLRSSPLDSSRPTWSEEACAASFALLRPWRARADRWVIPWASRRTSGSSSMRRELRMRPKCRRTRSNSYEHARATATIVAVPLEHTAQTGAGEWADACAVRSPLLCRVVAAWL